MKKIRLKELVQKLLHIEDTPERTALAYSVGVFFGFSPFLGFHTLAGLAIAFLFRLNRVAVLLGVWSNTPWWILPYYTLATWAGLKLTGFRMESSALREILRLGRDQGFFGSEFWNCLASQWGFFWSFTIGSSILSILLALAAYPFSLKWIRFYRHKKNLGDR
ncbi:MAG: DUF2062 domain-containing protein [Deltaproteobacteria bacterium]|nr:MAG: DUF2062 domain-containing protein [Deltaproteobacteria bacterium]